MGNNRSCEYAKGCSRAVRWIVIGNLNPWKSWFICDHCTTILGPQTRLYTIEDWIRLIHAQGGVIHPNTTSQLHTIPSQTAGQVAKIMKIKFDFTCEALGPCPAPATHVACAHRSIWCFFCVDHLQSHPYYTQVYTIKGWQRVRAYAEGVERLGGSFEEAMTRGLERLASGDFPV